MFNLLAVQLTQGKGKGMEGSDADELIAVESRTQQQRQCEQSSNTAVMYSRRALHVIVRLNHVPQPVRRAGNPTRDMFDLDLRRLED